jgi:RHS repeat-associated protein
VADDEAWSRVVLTQKTNSMLRLFANPSGSGVSQREIDSTASYAYKVPAISAQPCPDCTFGLYWGNQNDFDFLDFYNYRFMGFAQATVANPDGSTEVHTFNAGEGIGIYSSDTSQIACDPAVRFPCHRDPWWDTSNAAHGMETQVDVFDSDGTLLTRTTTSYTATCPPTGVDGSPNNIGWGSWDGMLVSEVDHSNPMAVCDIRATRADTYTFDGSASPSVPHSTMTSSYDSFGRLTSQTTTSNDGGANGSPTTIVKNTSYVQNDGVTATATSATGPYLIDFPAFQDTEDASGSRFQCTYTSYDGQANIQGQTSLLTLGEATRTDKYTNCGSAANNFTPSGQISLTNGYDTHGNQVTSTDPDGNAGNSAHLGCTVGGAQFSNCLSYDPTFAALPTTQTNALNQTTTTNYQPAASADASGGFGLWPVSITDANGQTTSTGYDALGRPVSQTTPGEGNGLTTTTTSYTDWCSGTEPQGACVEIDHTQRINGSTTVTSRAFFDGLGHLIETRVPAPGGRDVVRYSFYDQAQRLAFQSNAYFVPAYTGPPGPAAFSPPDTTVAGTTHSYPNLRTTVTVDSLSNQTTTSKSVVCGAAGTGDPACYEQSLTADPLGHQQATLTDAMGRQAYQQLYTGNSPASYAVYATSKYTYDFQGNLTGILEPDGTSKITFRYDMAGRKTGMTDPDRGTETYVLDQNGNQIQATDARGSAGTVFTGYDGLNRPLFKNATASTRDGAFVTYGYDSTAGGNFGVGKLTSETFTSAPSNSLSGSYIYRYDSRGQQAGSTLTVGNASYTLRTSYDDAGNVLTQVYPDGETVTNAYSPEAWLTGVQTQRGSYPATTLVSGIGYTGPGGATGEMTSASLGSGTFGYSASFDDMLRNTDVTIKNSFGTVLFDEARTFDGAGNVTTENTTLWPVGTDNQAFCYDEQNRLTWAGSRGTPPCTGSEIDPGSNLLAQYTQSFAYDNMGRLTQGPHGSYTYADPAHVHAATAVGDDWTAAYDGAGNMVCRAPSEFSTCAGSSPTGEQLSYDHTGQLVNWQDRPDYPGSTASFLYDGQGQRVAQRITQFGDTKLVVYVGGVEEVATDDGFTTTSTFYYANSLRMATAVNRHISYLANDALGSADATLSDGIVTASQLFAPYGELRFQLGTMPTTFGFTGQRGDAVSGLDYYGARYYDPMAGQFASADTVLEGNGTDILGLSRYAYVTGNPEVRTDSTGHCPWCIAAVVGAAVGAGIAYGSQVANNLQHGQSLGSALTHVDGGEIAKAALVGAVIGATGGLAGTAVVGALGAEAAATTAGTIATTAIAGGVGSGAGQVTDNLLNGRQVDDNVAQATAEGAVLGPIADYGGRFIGQGVGVLLGEGASEDAAVAATSACRNSFAGNTPVLMKNGSQKPIKDIRVGDMVKAENPHTGKVVARRVLATFDNSNIEGWVKIRAGRDLLKVTREHPFWVSSRGRFVAAGDIKPGDTLQTSRGQVLPVRGVTDFQTRAHHYNLTVRKLHTYFAGRMPVLVHNCSWPGLTNVGHLALGLDSPDHSQLLDFAGSIEAQTYLDPALKADYAQGAPNTLAYLRLIMGLADRITFNQEGFDVAAATDPTIDPAKYNSFTSWEYREIMANPSTLGIKTYFVGEPIDWYPPNPTEGPTA